MMMQMSESYRLRGSYPPIQQTKLLLPINWLRPSIEILMLLTWRSLLSISNLIQDEESEFKRNPNTYECWRMAQPWLARNPFCLEVWTNLTTDSNHGWTCGGGHWARNGKHYQKHRQNYARTPDISPKCRCQIQTYFEKFWETDVVKPRQNHKKSSKWCCQYVDGFHKSKQGCCLKQTFSLHVFTEK